MSVAHKQELTETKSKKDLGDVIAKAIKKMNVKKENELCKYIPVKPTGYMHHFTFKKLKHKQPQELALLLERHILQTDRVPVIPPKQRAARGSRKRRDHLNFTRTQLERMLNIARIAGDKEIITILSPKKSLASCKRELIQAIRHNEVAQELWDSYKDAVNAHQMLAALELQSR